MNDNIELFSSNFIRIKYYMFEIATRDENESIKFRLLINSIYKRATCLIK